ncbi:MAG: antitoxin family protein [Polyangia bacterium]
MKETFDAIYENGVLRPLRRLSMSEGRRIRLVIEQDEPDESAEPEGIDSAWLGAVSRNPAFAFLSDPEEDVYGPNDGEPLDD